ncbi:MAG: tRNA pseudouridine(13) synthase TruD [Tatlockia sp.]|nr:tRNA pseudouridine(13) synthase TruD [Tatlockia sp.]
MYDLANLSFAYGKPQSTGLIKTSADDFKVDEVLGFELTGEGEHLFLLIEKIGINTEELVKALARTLGKSEKAISYAGLKDRQAQTTQWLCVHSPGEELEGLDNLEGNGWRVIKYSRHLKKLKTGALAANEFELVLRELTEKSEIENRLLKIQSKGVPNYFGTQRFGHEGQNIPKAEAMLLGGIKIKNRFLRGLYYSTARSLLFNKILSERVQSGNWDQALAGDIMQLAGKNSIFPIEIPDPLINERMNNFDLSPAAPLWGKGEERASLEALVIQDKALNPYEKWCQALEQHGLERAYRPLRLQVEGLNWNWPDEQTLILKFRLEAGSYATSVLRELIREGNN